MTFSFDLQQARKVNGSLVEVAEQYIRQLIDNKKLRPGELIDFAELAKELETSRTPIRESIRQLHSAGLVESDSSGQFWVTRLSDDKIRSFFTVRIGLELKVLELAAERITNPEIDLLKRNLEIFRARMNDTSVLPRIDTQFHNIIYDASRNQYMAKRLKSLRSVLGLLPLNPYDNPVRVEEICVEHTAIAEALEQRDPEKSVVAIRTHLERSIPPLLG